MDKLDIQSLDEELSRYCNEGKGHLPTLVTRLGQLHSSLKQTSALCPEDAGPFLHRVVSMYFSSLLCTKLLKPCEKILSAVPVIMRPSLEDEMRKHVDELLHDKASLSRVCNLLDHSAAGRKAVHQKLNAFGHCLNAHMAASLGLSPSGLGSSGMRNLVLIAKAIVQLVQYYSEDLQSAMSSEKNCPRETEVLQNTISLLLEKILTVMSVKGYEVDVYFFGGTALMMILSLGTDKNKTIENIWRIQEIISSGSGHISIGHLSVNLKKSKSWESNLFASLSMTRAVIVCGKEELLCAVTGSRGDNPKSSGDNSLLLSLFPIIIEFIRDESFSKYHSFQVLSLWYKAVNRYHPVKLADSSAACIAFKGSNYLEETLALIFLNWDSPVDGVAEYAWDIFQTLLTIWNHEVEGNISDHEQFAEDLFDRLVDVPWYVKGKYKLLGPLLQYVDMSKSPRDHHLKHQLLKCMTTNNLAPLASDVYKNCLQQIRDLSEEDKLTWWQDTWLESILSSLMTNEPLLCKKLNDYWIPLTVTLIPASGTFLPEYLHGLITQTKCFARRSLLLHVWIVVMRILRSKTNIEEKDFNLQLLHDCLLSENENTQGEAVSFLCGTMKKSELLNDTESDLLHCGLPLCLRVDSAPFRQQLSGSIKKLLIRIRDGCLSGMKKSCPARVETSLKFLDWLHFLLIDNLMPGASYQRRKTCLDLLLVIYDTFVYKGDKQQKGHAGEKSVQLLEHAHKQGLCHFFTWTNFVVILNCIMDGADEVRDLGGQIVMKYYPWSVTNHETLSVEDLASHLLDIALSLCSSPRPQDTQSGALICSLICYKYASELGAVFQRVGDTATSRVTCTLTHTSAAPAFLEFLSSEIRTSLTLAEEDAVRASKETSMHGLVHAVTLCLDHSVKLGDQQLRTLVKISLDIIKTMLFIMAGQSKRESCPSFEEVGVALKNLADGDDESLSLTPEFQILLSWCWVNLKESCTCLGELTACALMSPAVDKSEWKSELQTVGSMFVQVLTECRIRGAIEGCRTGFKKFCSSLMSCDDRSLSAIPGSILEQVTKSLETKQVGASVTRRSAGLPIIIQVIVQAEQKHRQQKLLMTVLDALFDLSTIPFTSESDQTQDLVQVHALNILKVLYGDASLVMSLRHSYTKVVLLSINGFQSPSWAIRNAATQLFGAMVNRMFGQRSKEGTLQNYMTLQELSAHYPGLSLAMFDNLNIEMHDVQDINSMQPSWFVVLTILASLGPAETDQQSLSICDDFKKKIKMCLRSPVYTLRELSALAFVAFVPLDKREEEIAQLLQNLPGGENDDCRYNYLHGALLCIEKLISFKGLEDISCTRFVKLLLMKSWIATKLVHCPLLGAKYMDILCSLVHASDLGKELKESVILVLHEFLLQKDAHLQIGQGLVKEAVRCMFHVLHDRPAELTKICCDWLRSDDLDICQACVSVIEETFQNAQVDLLEVQVELWKLLETGRCHITLLASVMNLLCDIHLHQDFTPNTVELASLSELAMKYDSQSCVHAARIPVTAILIKNSLGSQHMLTEESKETISTWCSQVREFSCPRQNENHRTASAKALKIAGSAVLSLFHEGEETLLKDCLVWIFEASLNLLEDAEADIRKMVSEFVTVLQKHERTARPYNLCSIVCQKVLFEYMSKSFSWSSSLLKYLLQELYQPGRVVAVCQNNRFNSRVEVLFEQEDGSMLSERPIRMQMVHTALKSILSMKQVKLPWKLTSDVLADLKFCVPMLQKELLGQPVLNPTCDSIVFATLTGLLLMSDVVLSRKEVSDVISAEIQDHLTSIEKMIGIHPWLADQVTNILQNLQV